MDWRLWGLLSSMRGRSRRNESMNKSDHEIDRTRNMDILLALVRLLFGPLDIWQLGWIDLDMDF